jgi:fructose-1-phosphate kinase PfkB-like protein
LHGLSFKETVVCGIAAGTANTLKIGAGQFNLEDFERLRSQVQISDEVQ